VTTTTTTAGGAPREARDSFLNHYIPYKNNNLTGQLKGNAIKC